MRDWMRRWVSLGSMAGAIASASPAFADQVDLRVLLVARGQGDADPGRQVMEDLFESLGVAYETLDSSARPLTEELLYWGPERNHGRFNGIILTDAETYISSEEMGLGADEFALLHDYERRFGVREAIMSGFPSWTASADYGVWVVDAAFDVDARWTGAAGGTELFEYVNTDNLLPTEGFAFLAEPREFAWGGPSVHPLLVDEDNPQYALISRLDYPDGRQALLSTLNQTWWNTHSQVLAYEFLNFATSGLFLGARRTYLEAHNDDLFLADEVWNPATDSNFPPSEREFRLSAGEVEAAVEAQVRFRNAHPLAGTFKTDWAFNGVGADLQGDPLTAAIVQHASEFGFINHTYEALQLDRLCPPAGEPADCVRTDYDTIYEEIFRNAEIWGELGLPEPQHALTAVLTDSHSGMEDRLGTQSREDDIFFPEGFNPALGQAASDLGVRMLAGDASRPNQTRIQRIADYDLVLLPRYPTSVYYNTTTPSELVSEYNYIHHRRYLEAGQDPCSLPAALCEPRSYEDILDSEAATTLRHILSYQPFPHYFHQVNLHVYDAAGRSLQFDWLERVLSEYESLVTLPLRNPRFDELAELAWQHVLAREVEHTAVLDLDTGTVEVVADAEVALELTGIVGSETYGGQSIGRVMASPTPAHYTVDRAWDR